MGNGCSTLVLVKWQKLYLLVVGYWSSLMETCLLSSMQRSYYVWRVYLHAMESHCGADSIATVPNSQITNLQSFLRSTDGLVHQTSSPYYPRSNCMTKSCKYRAKRLLKKAVASGKDPYLTLLNYQASPLQKEKSPAIMLYSGRKIATRLLMGTQASWLRGISHTRRMTRVQKGHVRITILTESRLLVKRDRPARVETSNGSNRNLTILHCKFCKGPNKRKARNG